MSRFFVVLSVLSALVGSSQSARAQGDSLAELYGRGVHAYFANDYMKASELLTLAVDSGTKDPRVFFFRGLTMQSMGRPDEAQSDFQTGATMEATGRYPFSIPKALERVQGVQRLEIEGARQMARLAARTQQEELRQANYEETKRNEAATLRNPDTIPPPVPPMGDDPNNPFGAAGMNSGEPQVGSAPATPAPATPATPDTSNPFGDDPVQTPATDDPFGGAGDMPATDDPFKTPGTTPGSTPGGADPFGTDDPFK